ncbi:MAG: aminotransferase class IV [Thermoflexales bacterium]|nr:aminotransferase class IV [Thermoflexales bacterium]MCS7324559.1 aminotransferase class IV [Thermoflexales bacterium]
MVITFRLRADGALETHAQHGSMSEASAALPQGAYTTFRTYDGHRVLRLEQHVHRLEESLALMGRAATLDVAHVRQGVAQALRLTSYPESRFRLTFAPPDLFISIEPFTPYPPELYQGGVWCVTVPLRRENPHAKSTAFIASASAAYRSLPDGAHEGLMVAEDGAILEGLSSNFFAILPDAAGKPVLRTEEARVLIGVTRSLVLEIARTVLPIHTEAVHYADLPRVREAFITSVSREILPVVKIDDRVIGDGTPGAITRMLMARFAELVAREARSVFDP